MGLAPSVYRREQDADRGWDVGHLARESQLAGLGIAVEDRDGVAVLVARQQMRAIRVQRHAAWNASLGGDVLHIRQLAVRRIHLENSDAVMAPVGGVEEQSIVAQRQFGGIVLDGEPGWDGVDI